MPHLEPPPFGSYKIVCPHCKAQNHFMLSGDYTDVFCPSCNGRFRIFLATVRGKRGRVSGSTREHIIRTVTRSGEIELRFVDYGGSDLSLRSSDAMYTCYTMNESGAFNSTPSILCNLTIHQYAEMKPPRKSGCFIATVACGHDSWEVKTLTDFRDSFLLKNRTGILFVRFYYWISPFLVSHISEKENLKENTRRFVVSPVSVFVSRLFQTRKKES